MEVTNDAFIEFASEDEPLLSGDEPIDLQRKLIRQAIAMRFFSGRGADSEEAFHVELVAAARERREIRAAFAGTGTPESLRHSLGLALILAVRDGRDRETALRDWIKVSDVPISRTVNQKLQEGCVVVYSEALKRRTELKTVLQKISL